MSELKVNRATVIEWLDANEIEVTHTQLAGLFSSAIEAAQAQEDAGGWMRNGALLYRLTDERRPANFDEIRVTMANGSRDIGQMSAQAERLLVMLTAPQPAAPTQAGEYQPSSADMVMAALDTEEWGLERIQRCDYISDEGNREGAWLVKRQKAPYCACYTDKPGAPYGPRSWSGPTALDALQKAADDLGIRLPQPAARGAAQAAPAAVAGPSEAVAYLDIGTGGYLDLGTDLADEALSRLPKGRHALVIAGTYGIDGYTAASTPQAAPPPQAAPAGVLEDAARWHWMAEYLVGTRTDLDDELIASATVDELSKLVDADLAARKQGGQHAE